MTLAGEPEELKSILERVLSRLEDPTQTDHQTRIAKLEMTVDRLEAGFANWKTEMSRLASRIEKQAWRAEKAREENGAAEIVTPPEEPLSMNDRILARRSNALLPNQ
jgi:hypothetical protein